MNVKVYKWIPFLLIIFAAMQPLHAQPVLDLVHVKPDHSKAYVVAEMSELKTNQVQLVFSCRPKIKIRDYHQVKVNRHKAQTRSYIFCPKYIHVKVFTGRMMLADSLNVALIRKIIAHNKIIAEK